MHSKISETSDSQILLLNLSDKTNLKREAVNMLLHQILAYTIHGKILKNYTKTTYLKYQLRHGMNSLNYLMMHILYQIFRIFLNIS